MHVDHTPEDAGRAAPGRGAGTAAAVLRRWRQFWGSSIRRRQTWLVVLTYLLVLASPLSIFFITGATILLFAVALWNRFRERPPERLPRWMLVAFALLPLAAVLSALANVEPWVNLINLRKEYAFFLPLALLPALRSVNTRNLLLALVVPVTAVALYGVVQYFFGVDWSRPEGQKLITRSIEQGSNVFHGKGTFSHHLTYAGYMLLLVPLFAALALKDKGWARFAWGLGAAMAGVGTLVSMGRSGWLGAAVGMLLLGLGFPRRRVLPLVAVAVFLGLAGTLAAGGWLQDAIPYDQQPGLVKRLLSTSAWKDRERLYIWEATLMGIRDNPVLGVGYGNDKYHAPRYRKIVAAERNYEFGQRLTTHAHNIFLQVAFELGVLGLLAYLYLWGAVLVWCGRWVERAGSRFPFESALLAGASCALVGSMVAGFFESNFFDAEVRTLILLLMGFCLHAGLNVRQGLAANPPPSVPPA